MGLSKRYLDTNKSDISFSLTGFAVEMEKKLPQAVFAYLIGSAAGTETDTVTVKARSDLDLALYISGQISFEIYGTVQDICDNLAAGVRCDTGILNNAEPVYRFEALRGRLLFSRDEDLRLTFYSRTCREYESVMFHYEKQRRYRMEARGEI
jgi:predicted nucleotidyltransferase